MRALIRADASPTLGLGHLLRALALAQALRRQGVAVAFACRDDARGLADPVARAGFPLHWLAAARPLAADADARDSAALIETLAPEGLDWLIVDHYGLGHAWQQRLRQRARRILVIDDLADRHYDADVLLNPNLPEEPERYRGRVPDRCRLLLGPRFALLREEFLRMPPRPRAGRARRLLVNFGGGAAPAAARLAWEALTGLAARGRLDGLRIDWIGAAPASASVPAACWRGARLTLTPYTDELAARLALADLALGAGGVSLWERCWLGVPALVIQIAANQRRATEALARRGAIWNLGPLAALTPARLARRLDALLAAPARLRAASDAARALLGAADFMRDPLPWLAVP